MGDGGRRVNGETAAGRAYGFRFIFGLSGTARLLSILLFIRLVREVRPAPGLRAATAERG